jgi:hypothetical protein
MSELAWPGGSDRHASTPGNLVDTARKNYVCGVLGPGGGHVGQHGTTHSVNRAEPFSHKHELIGPWAGPA